ncbi:MAG: tetratricopeptide repeat protein [Candidatus Rokubacteria bacterium]|nr:tetratricopeptide repeat protein [Candidatus Rokubacteria bacterium]
MRAPRRAAFVVAALAAAILIGVGSPTEAQSVFEGFRRSVRAQDAFARGKVLYEARDYEGARERLGEALTLDPNHDEARALLGWSQYFLGEYRAAIITFKAAIQREPAWEGHYSGLGWSRLRLKRYHLATEAFRAALDHNPDYVDAMIGLGTSQFELGRYEAALAPLQTALRRLEPLVGREPAELPEVRAKVAWTLYYLGRYREALALFERGVRATPDWHGLYNGLGWCYLKLGQKPEARAAFQRALTLKPGYEDALEGLRQASNSGLRFRPNAQEQVAGRPVGAQLSLASKAEARPHADARGHADQQFFRPAGPLDGQPIAPAIPELLGGQGDLVLDVAPA